MSSSICSNPTTASCPVSINFSWSFAWGELRKFLMCGCFKGLKVLIRLLFGLGHVSSLFGLFVPICPNAFPLSPPEDLACFFHFLILGRGLTLFGPFSTHSPSDVHWSSSNIFELFFFMIFSSQFALPAWGLLVLELLLLSFSLLYTLLLALPMLDFLLVTFHLGP